MNIIKLYLIIKNKGDTMENKKTKKNLKELSSKFVPTLKNIFIYMKKVNFNRKMKVIGDLILLIVLLCILKLPFSVIRDLIINAFFSVEIANTLLMNMLYLLFGIPYYILVIYLFVKNIVNKYENLEVGNNITNNEIQDNSSILKENDISKNEEVSFSSSEEKNELSNISNDTNVNNNSFTNNENIQNTENNINS